jgi:O-antigen ligase
MTAPASTASPAWILRWAPAWVLLAVALWPLPGLSAGVLGLGALGLLAHLLHTRFRGASRYMAVPAWALATVLFAAHWLPQLVSLPDALLPLAALRKVLTGLLALPLLWLAALAVAGADGRRRVFAGLGLIALAWTLDALVAVAIGTSPLFWLLEHGHRLLAGQPWCRPQDVIAPGRLSGVFGPCNPKLGIVLACLAPFALCWAYQRLGAVGSVLVAVAIGGVILLAGARAAWVSYAVVLLWLAARQWGRRGVLATVVAMMLGLATLVVLSPSVQERVQRSALVLQPQTADAALSGRLRIWSAALCMWTQHPVNGVGVRGFRAAFAACDPQPGVSPAWGTGTALHAHQLVLEVASETGTLGLLLWLAGVALAWRAWRHADADARAQTFPALLALVAAVFPLNTHLAVHSTFWGGVVLLLAGLYAGSLWGRVEAGDQS